MGVRRGAERGHASSQRVKDVLCIAACGGQHTAITHAEQVECAEDLAGEKDLHAYMTLAVIQLYRMMRYK